MNRTAGFNNFIDPGVISAGVTALSNFGTAALQKTELQGNVKAACGARPLFAGARRDSWNKCANDFAKTTQSNDQAKFMESEKSKRMLIIAAASAGVIIIGATVFIIVKFA